MKKNSLLIVLFLILFANLNAQEKVNPSDDLISNVGFRPVDPINYVYPIAFYKFSDEFYQKMMTGQTTKEELMQIATKSDKCFVREDRNIYFSDIPNKNIVDLLPNETVEIQISEITGKGGLSLKGAAAISSKNTSYQVTMDYVKYVTINVVDTLNFGKNNQVENMSIFSYARVGAGLRIVASIKTKKKGINLGDLFAIGFAASKNDVSGSLSVNILGVESREITSLLPMPSEISSSSIQNAMQAMATIKSKIYDENVEIRPQIISIRSVNPLITTDD
ncbi:MAG: hypothetical protein WD512_12695, partial [Candidatus Paceibacterota bacterium]